MQKFDQILGCLNLHIDNNQKYILSTVALTTLLATYIQPCLTKEIITSLPAEWLAIQSLVLTVSVIIIGMIWQGKIRFNALKYFIGFCLIESIVGCLLGLYLCFIEFNVLIFAITSLIYTSFITIFVGKCIMAFKAKLWQEKEREIYDNNTEIISGIVCIIGYLLALFLMPPLKIALFIWSANNS